MKISLYNQDQFIQVIHSCFNKKQFGHLADAYLKPFQRTIYFNPALARYREWHSISFSFKL